MSLKLSEALRNHMLATGSLANALAGGRMVLFGGDAATFPTRPEQPVNVSTHPVLMEVNPVSMGATAAQGTIGKETAVWSATTVAGTPVAYRHVDSTDDGIQDDTVSLSKKRIQGSVGAGGDMFLTDVAFDGSTETINYHNLTMPETLSISS